ncbi:ABC transporter substrate-binding protein [Nocardia sp. NBC_01503]|uniref:ABC transporter substrate-binding protein n=1 Tax=Nocardia sp. NBC_01503 TaxID=2975997 RepID=UPI002E7AD17B|nr:ABC transporter substrate-binding protein [Nocardia sp. NBC_01503]WTL30310.1 ABC transporter substrate-binding protein [Nocardia sp. NBC_01503]
MKKRLLAAAALAGSLSLVLTACGGESSSPKPTGQGVLAGVCPATVVIQTDWYATPERAAAYQLVGPNGTVDAKKGAYVGPLGDTGVNVEVRLGGPFLGGQPVPAQMYQDTSITLGLVPTDEQVRAKAKTPLTGVFASLDVNPQIVMWDPATYPQVKSWQDVAATGAPILYSEGKPYMDYLVDHGFVKKEQLDASYDGTPSRFVAEKGRVMQQGYVSNEPYRWEHDVKGWQKPTGNLLVADSGYESYPHAWSVRTGELDKLRPCLRKLVPMLQQAQIDYATNPAPTNEALLRISQGIPDGPPITAGGNADSVKVQLAEKIIGNGPDNTLGNFDTARVDRAIAQVAPILKARGQQVPDGLTAADLVTNEFIDTTKGLKAQG